MITAFICVYIENDEVPQRISNVRAYVALRGILVVWHLSECKLNLKSKNKT